MFAFTSFNASSNSPPIPAEQVRKQGWWCGEGGIVPRAQNYSIMQYILPPTLIHTNQN